MTVHGEDLTPGRTVGEYQIEMKIGQGTFGKVYAAVHPIIGKRVAIKVLNPQFATSEEMVSRFISEARAVNQIGHRNIIDIFAFGTLDEGLHYFVMELLRGQTFEDYLAAQGPLPLEQAAPILGAVARALDAAHAHGIAHRDLKPENIFLEMDDDGHIFPKLLDFGIAKLLGDVPTGHRTATGVPLGTPLYMSPEQCRGTTIDHRTDIYSFGVVVFEALTGSRPFNGESVMDIMMCHLAEEPPPPSHIRRDLPPALDAPLRRMMAKRAADRPPTATDALDAVMAAAGTARPSSGAISSLPRETGAYIHAQNLGVAHDGATHDGAPPTFAGAATHPGPAPGGWPMHSAAGHQPHSTGHQPHSTGHVAPPAPAATAATTLGSYGAPGASTTGGVIGPNPPSSGSSTKLFVAIGLALALVAAVVAVVAFVSTDGPSTAADADDDDAPDDTIEIGQAPLPPGATLDEKLDYIVDGTFTSAAQPGLLVTWKSTQTMRRTINIKRSDDYLVREAEVRFQDYRTVVESSINGTPEPPEVEVESHANQNFIVSTDDGRTLSILPLGGGSPVAGPLAKELEKELLRHFEPRPDVFKRELSEGDTVEPPSDLMGHVLGAEDHDGTMIFTESTLTYTGHDEKAGRELASFDVSTHLSETSEEGSFESDLTGEIALDLDTGWPVAVAVKGPVTGHVVSEGVKLDLEGRATIAASSIITSR